jgi:hypothetical protein
VLSLGKLAPTVAIHPNLGVLHGTPGQQNYSTLRQSSRDESQRPIPPLGVKLQPLAGQKIYEAARHNLFNLSSALLYWHSPRLYGAARHRHTNLIDRRTRTKSSDALVTSVTNYIGVHSHAGTVAGNFSFLVASESGEAEAPKSSNSDRSGGSSNLLPSISDAVIGCPRTQLEAVEIRYRGHLKSWFWFGGYYLEASCCPPRYTSRAARGLRQSQTMALFDYRTSALLYRVIGVICQTLVYGQCPLPPLLISPGH